MSAQQGIAPASSLPGTWVAYGLIAIVGAAQWWGITWYPARMPAVAPFEFQWPQIVLGALITFSTRDVFPYYAFCGRYFPSISAVTDQQIGGIVIWIPPAMMSVIGLLVVVRNTRAAGADF